MNPSPPTSPNPLTRRQFIGATMLPLAAGVSARAEDAKPLRAAVIGHTGRGDYGHGLDAIFTGRPGVELVALADPDETGRQRTAEKIRAPRAYTDPLEMLRKEQPQLVSIAMRHADQHHALIIAALRAGAHVYSEKPFVTAPAEADEILREAEQRKLRIAVAHTMRSSTAVSRLKQAWLDGLLGEVREMRAYGKQDTRAGGEDMMVLGSHLFDLMRLFAGDPLWCHARVLSGGRDITTADRRTVKDNVGWVAGDEIQAQFAFKDGLNATFTSCAALRQTVGHWGIEFHGSKVVARLNCDVAPNIFLRKAGTWAPAGRTDAWEPLDPATVKLPPEHTSDPVGDWLDAIRQNREPACSGRNGAWAVEMVAAVYASALAGRRATFPLTNRTHPLGG